MFGDFFLILIDCHNKGNYVEIKIEILKIICYLCYHLEQKLGQVDLYIQDM